MVSIYFRTPLFTCGCSRINRLPMTELMMGIGFYLPRCTAAGRLGWLGAFERVLHWGSCFKLLNRSRLWQTVSEWVVSELVRASDWHARRGRTSVQRPASVQLTSSTGRCPSGPAQNDPDRPLFPRIARRWQSRYGRVIVRSVRK